MAIATTSGWSPTVPDRMSALTSRLLPLFTRRLEGISRGAGKLSRVRTPPTRFVGEPGSRIAYATFGRGRPPVLLLPHWASNIDAIWSEPAFVRFATKLASVA